MSDRNSWGGLPSYRFAQFPYFTIDQMGEILAELVRLQRRLRCASPQEFIERSPAELYALDAGNGFCSLTAAHCAYMMRFCPDRGAATDLARAAQRRVAQEDAEHRAAFRALWRESPPDSQTERGTK